MIVISTNVAEPKTIEWNGRQVQTGIYKNPVTTGIYLGEEDVENDHVLDRRYHGGKDKACYLYSADHYSFWREKYPGMDWQWGMFGENLTVSGISESVIRIGDEYRIGEAHVQVSQPRQPCYKLGVRFGTQDIVRDFWQSEFPGVYVRVLKPGKVMPNDEMILLSSDDNAMSLADVFSVFTSNRKNEYIIKRAVSQNFLAQSCKNDISKLLNML